MKLKALIAASLAALLTGTAITLAQLAQPGVNSNLAQVWTLAWETASTKPTYMATVNGVTPVSSGTDLCTLTGSATKTILVRRVVVAQTAATTAVTEPVSIVKRSTASTGAGTAIPVTSYDSQNATSTAAMVEVWTANPTAGTLVGLLADRPMFFGLGGVATNSLEFNFGGSGRGEPIVLRGAAQSISVNFSGITLTGTLHCSFEWTEE